MKDRHLLQETYADLLHNETDSDLLQLVQDLDSICNASPLPARLNWAEVRGMHTEQTFEKRVNILPFRARQWRPLLHKAVLMPALAALVLITAAFTLTWTPLMRNLLGSEPYGNLFVGLHGSQTVDGLTFTLQEGYADSEQVIVGYTVTPVKQYNNPVKAELSTQDGTGLPALSGSEEADKYALDNAWFFDSSSIADNPETLNLQLKVQIFQIPTATGPISTVTTQEIQADRAQGIPVPAPKTLGTVTFNFTLPFHPGKILAPGLQATSHGQTITLEQVGVSRSATRIVVKGLVQNVSKRDVAFLTLQVPGARNYHEYPDLGQFGADGSGTTSYVYFDDFSQNQGTWTLTITQGIDTWVFHFRVPA